MSNIKAAIPGTEWEGQEGQGPVAGLQKGRVEGKMPAERAGIENLRERQCVKLTACSVPPYIYLGPLTAPHPHICFCKNS